MDDFIKQTDIDNLADIIWWIKGYYAGAMDECNSCPFTTDHSESLRKIRLILMKKNEEQTEDEKPDEGREVILPDSHNQKQKRTIKWTAEIEKIVLPGRAFSVEQIKEALILNGIKQANTQQGRSSITTTLGRMIKNKKIVKTGNGFYRSNKGENKNE